MAQTSLEEMGTCSTAGDLQALCEKTEKEDGEG